MDSNYVKPRVRIIQQIEQTPVPVTINNYPALIIAPSYKVHENTLAGTCYGVENKTFSFDGTPLFNNNIVSEKAYLFYPLLTTIDKTRSFEPNTVNDSDFVINAETTYEVLTGGMASIPCYKFTPEEEDDGDDITYGDEEFTLTVKNCPKDLTEFSEGFVKIKYDSSDPYTDIIITVDTESIELINGEYVIALKHALNPVPAKYSYLYFGANSFEGIQIEINPALKLTETLATPATDIVYDDGDKTLTISNCVAEFDKVANLVIDLTYTYDGTTQVTDSIRPTYVREDTGDYIFYMADVLADPTPDSFDTCVFNYMDEDEVVLKETPYIIKDSTITPNGAVKVGDIIEFRIGTTSVEASILNIIKGEYHINTFELTNYAEVFYQYEFQYLFDSALVNTVNIRSYTIKRLFGYSQNRGVTGTITVDENCESDQFLFTADTISVGDVVVLGTSPNTDDLALVTAVDNVDANDLITLESDLGEYGVDGAKIAVYDPRQTSQVYASYREVNTDNIKELIEIKSIDDIVNNYGDTSFFNEAAYMLNLALLGGKSCFCITFDPSSDSTVEIADVIDEIKFNKDIYEIVVGSTDPSINSAIQSYVDEQSLPENEHESIAILTVDIDNLIFKRQFTKTLSGFTVDLGGVYQDLKKGDYVKLYEVTGELYDTCYVTKVVGQVVTFDTTYTGTYLIKFYAGNKDEIAAKISESEMTDKRLKLLYPGYFTGTYDFVEIDVIPPYYISALKSGFDSKLLEPQPHTNLRMSIPDLTNIYLKSNFYFDDPQLNILGGSGFDIMISDKKYSNSFYSRHDITTYPGIIEYRSWSVTKQVDKVSKTFRKAFKPEVGTFNINDDTAILRLKTKNTSVIAGLKEKHVKSIAVIKMERDKYQVDKLNIVLKVVAYIAGDYIDIILNVTVKE